MTRSPSVALNGDPPVHLKPYLVLPPFFALISLLPGACVENPGSTPQPRSTFTQATPPIQQSLPTATTVPTPTIVPTPTMPASTPAHTPTPTPIATLTPIPTTIPIVEPTPTATTIPIVEPTPTPTTVPTPTPTLTPTPPYVPLTASELKSRLDFVYETNPITMGYVTVYGATTRVEEQFYDKEALEIFTEGYYMLTGTTPALEGWIPQIYSKVGYDAIVDEHLGGSPHYKTQVLGWCCITNDSGLELIIRGDQPLSTVILTLAHESGHARQRVLNPGQSRSPNDSNTGALREAEAFAFAIAFVRALEASTGANVSRFPNWPSVQSFIDEWTVTLRENVDNVTQEHDRGIHLLWLAALADPTMESELRESWLLSPSSLFRIHAELIARPADLIDEYVTNLLSGSRNLENMIRGTIAKRLDSGVQREGFLKYDIRPVIIP